MKSKNMVLLALAIGCGLVAAFLTAKLGATNKTEMVPVLVAAKNLDQGLKLDEPEKLFVRKPYPPESVPPEFINDLAALKGKVLQRTVRPGATVSVADITPPKTLTLPVRADGTMYKAMGIKVAQETVAGGLVIPGDHVDIISIERYQNGKMASVPVLQNVLVVAVNARAQLAENETVVKDAATVTVAVTHKEAMQLSLADTRGVIRLLLRSKDDQTKEKNVKSIEALGKPEDDAGGGADASLVTTRVPVPKKTIEPGTKVDNPDDLFEEKEFRQGDVPVDAIVEMGDLKGKTFKGKAYAGLPVVKAAFEGDVPKAPGTPEEAALAIKPPGQTMVIQVGTSAPQYFHYDHKGRMTEDGKAPAAAPPPPPPEKAVGGSPAIIKPVEAEKDPEK